MGEIQIGVQQSIDLHADEAALGVPDGYGLDPNMVTPTVPWPLTVTPVELTAIEILADAILPGSFEPAPSRVGIAAFFNEWLSAPYQQQLMDRKNVLGGLTQLNAESRARYGVDLPGLSPIDLQDILSWLSNATGTINNFFVRFRYLVVGGYFTTDDGMQAIGYRGNVPLSSFPPVTSDGQAIIQDQLAKLGLL